MIGYVTIGVGDIESARTYYDALFAMMGAKRIMQMDDYNGYTLYATSMTEPGVAITGPYNGEAPHPGNGNMIALVFDARAKVDAFHAKALELGGSDEGAPGLRGDESMGFYGAYFRDPEGNKLCAFAMGAAS